MTAASPELARALAYLERGKVVAAATESFFGLLADVTRPDAIETLLGLKPRGADKGIPILLPDQASWALLASAIPVAAQTLSRRFWPGPLSIALPAQPRIDPRIALSGTIAVRMPGPSVAAELVTILGRPLTATSANLPGEPPATRDAEVATSFSDAIERGDLMVLAGTAPGGKPSTVIVVRDGGVHVAREGAIPSATVLGALATA